MGRAVARVLWPRKVRDDVVRGAGGILLREVAGGRHEVAVVHRPARGDWSLPKGKLDPGESYESCALREVLEETGYRCRLVSFVGFTEYQDRRGRPKVVGYWVMEVLDGEFAVSDEVDELQWLELDVAARSSPTSRDPRPARRARHHGRGRFGLSLRATAWRDAVGRFSPRGGARRSPRPGPALGGRLGPVVGPVGGEEGVARTLEGVELEGLVRAR